MVRIEADPPNTRLRRRAPPALHGSPRIPRPASVTLDHRGEQRQPDVADEHDEPFTHGGAAPQPDAVVGVASRFKANAARSRAPPGCGPDPARNPNWGSPSGRRTAPTALVAPCQSRPPTPEKRNRKKKTQQTSSEEHTYELQSIMSTSYDVIFLKKK